MLKIRKIQLHSKQPLRSASPYRPIFTLRTKLLLFSGLFLLILPLIFYLNQSIQLMYVTPNVKTLPVVHTKTRSIYPPTKITIPQIALSLPVISTAITDNTWTIAPDGVSHLKASASPGEKGPIILYAHNTKDRFGPIRWIKTGESITLMTSDAKSHEYKIIETVTASPEELSVFFQRKSETLYLFTCDGFADLKRFIVIAEPVSTASVSASLD